MTDTISLTGLVATTPKHIVTANGLSITSFRFASTQRRYDRGEQKWVDGDTNWYSVSAFRQLAINVATSVQKGQRVVITGRLRVREWSTDAGHGINVEIDADAVGHDLSWGTTVFTRSTATAVAEADTTAERGQDAEAVAGGSSDGDAATGGSGTEQADVGDDLDAAETADHGAGGGAQAGAAVPISAAVPF